jgi:hypothetical protein
VDGQDKRYDRASRAAATILNQYFDPSKPKYWLHGKILMTILDAIYEFEEGFERSRIKPSNN